MDDLRHAANQDLEQTQKALCWHLTNLLSKCSQVTSRSVACPGLELPKQVVNTYLEIRAGDALVSGSDLLRGRALLLGAEFGRYAAEWQRAVVRHLACHC